MIQQLGKFDQRSSFAINQIKISFSKRRINSGLENDRFLKLTTSIKEVI